MIEFETLTAGKVAAPLSAVAYVRHHDGKYIVVMAAGPGSDGWEISKETFREIQEAIRGYEQLEAADKAA